MSDTTYVVTCIVTKGIDSDGETIYASDKLMFGKKRRAIAAYDSMCASALTASLTKKNFQTTRVTFGFKMESGGQVILEEDIFFAQK